MNCQKDLIGQHQQIFVVRKRPLIWRLVQHLNQRLRGLRQIFRSQKVALPFQRVLNGTKVLGAECGAEHLPGCIAQFVSLVHNQGAVVRKDRYPPGAAVDGIG